MLDALIGDISDNVEKNDHDASNSLKQNPTEIVPFGESTPFQTKELINICERLNLQNRIAKLASMQCQRLFLSLFFNGVLITKDHYFLIKIKIKILLKTLLVFLRI